MRYPLVDTKISGYKFEEKEDICMISKYLPTRHLSITKWKVLTLQRETLWIPPQPRGQS